MDIEKFKSYILSSEDILMEKVLKYAIERNYVKYTSTLKEAWRLSIAGLSEALIKVMDKKSDIPELGPDDDYANNEIAEFGIKEAGRHRSRGTTLAMFLGLMKYYQQAYVDLVNESNFLQEEKAYFCQYIKRYFDHVELGFTVQWSEMTGKDELNELQVMIRAMTNEKNKYLTIFESMYDPIILVDKDNNIENINASAAELFLNELVSGKKYYGKVNINGEFDFLKEDLLQFFELNQNEVLKEKTIETKNGQKTFLIKFKKMLDVSEKYRGTVIKFYDITERLKFEKELKQQQEKLESYAYTDPMTGVSNRRTGYKILEKEIALLKEKDTSLSICFIDVDGLKSVNDNYGHIEGDNLLNFVASTFKSSIRKTDTVSRYGGDEFLIVFPDSSEANAETILRQIYGKFEAYDKECKKPYKHCFSYGLMELTKDTKLGANEVINEVDSKMYQQKFLKKSLAKKEV